MKNTKTNVMRLLDKGKVPYTPLYYDLGHRPFSGEAVCEALGLDPAGSFKTLCAEANARA